MKLHFLSGFVIIPPGHGLRQQHQASSHHWRGSRTDHRGLLGTTALTLTLLLTSVLCFHGTEGTSPGKPLPGFRKESIFNCEVSPCIQYIHNRQHRQLHCRKALQMEDVN